MRVRREEKVVEGNWERKHRGRKLEKGLEEKGGVSERGRRGRDTKGITIGKNRDQQTQVTTCRAI